MAFARIPKKASIAAFLSVVAIVYFTCLPNTPQTLDSSELVASAYRLNVPHPPGFPLYVWVQFLFTHLLPLGSVFWRASLLTAFFSLGTLLLLSIRRSPLFLATCLLPLAFSKTYWEYSVIPDVFMLNVLLMTGMTRIYFTEPPSERKTLWLLLLFALGVSNHPMILFAFPMVADAIFENRSVKTVFSGMLLASLTCIALYASLLALHPESLFSWGNLHGLRGLFRHFTRRDYGTLQLSIGSKKTDFLRTLMLFGKSAGQSVPVALAFSMIALLTGQSSRKLKVVFGMAVLYVLTFCLLANVKEDFILERFFLFGLIFLVFSASEAISLIENHLSKPAKTILCLTALGLALSGWALHHEENDFSSNTVVEDYAENLFRMARPGRKTVFVVDGDTRCHALHYLQSVGSDHPDDLVLCLGTIFSENQFAKIQRHWPDFTIDPQWASGPRAHDIFKNIVDPNLDRYDFVFVPPVDPTRYKVTYLGLGRRVSRGEGIEVDLDSLKLIQRRFDPSGSGDPREFNELKLLYAEYAFPYLKLGMLAKDPGESLRYFEEAVSTVPFCIPAIQNICTLQRSAGLNADLCERQLGEMRLRGELNYF